MSRILFFVIIIAVIYFAWRSMRMKQIQLEKRLDQQEREHQNSAVPQRKSERLVSCEHCGLYVPIHEAVERGGKYYCSEDHARLGPKEHR